MRRVRENPRHRSSGAKRLHRVSTRRRVFGARAGLLAACFLTLSTRASASPAGPASPATPPTGASSKPTPSPAPMPVASPASHPAPQPPRRPTAEGPVRPQLPTLDLLPWKAALGSTSGDWAEYALLIGGYPVGPYLRFLVVGQDVFEGRPATWIELWISQRPGSASQAYRMLVAADRSGKVAVRRTLVRLLGGEVQEIAPEELIGSGGSGDRGPRPAEAPRVMGQAQPTAVLTPAGSFVSRLVRFDDRADGAKAWFSERVPLFGLVRLETAGQLGLELHATGTGGESVVAVPPAAP